MATTIRIREILLPQPSSIVTVVILPRAFGDGRFSAGGGDFGRKVHHGAALQRQHSGRRALQM